MIRHMESIEVSAAIIIHDGRILAAQRGYGEYKDGWEFPGGKLEPGESGEEACIRELREELSIGISCEKELCTVEWDYPRFHLTMHCYISSITEGSIEMKEHEALRWVSPEELDSVAWLEADWIVVKAIKEYLGK